MNNYSENLNELKVEALKSEFSLKIQSNPSYSMRAFARDLEVSHTLLSFILNGKRTITNSFSEKIIKNNKISKNNLEVFSLGLKKELSKEQEFEKLNANQTSLLSDWTYYAVLSLLEVEGFKWNRVWIGSRLGISQSKARAVMLGLTEMEMIEEYEPGKYKQKLKKIVVENTEAIDAVKKYNRGLLKKASDSMETCQFKHRDISSTTFTLNPKNIPFAMKQIRAFRRQLTDQLESMGNQEEVYALAVQLFPLSDVEKKS